MAAKSELERRLALEVPIVQGPFGGGFSTPRLAAAVSGAGGLGSFGAHQLSPSAILDSAASIRALTARPFALNLWVSNRDFEGGLPRAGVERMMERLAPYARELGIEPAAPIEQTIHRFEDQAQAVLEARPAVFSFVFGVPRPEILRECRRRDIATIGAATTPDEARALEQAGVDAVVASGFEAGGHRPSFLARAEESLMGTMSLVPLVRQAVRLPVIAAGGIADFRGVRAAMTLGAQAAQVGTAFLACEESGAPELHRRMLFEPARRRTVLSRVYSGRLARGISNRLHEELKDSELLPYPAQGWAVGTLRAAALAQGRSDLVAMWCGQSAGLLRARRAEELMATLTSE